MPELLLRIREAWRLLVKGWSRYHISSHHIKFKLELSLQDRILSEGTEAEYSILLQTWWERRLCNNLNVILKLRFLCKPIYKQNQVKEPLLTEIKKNIYQFQ